MSDIEKLIEKIADTQAFSTDDALGRMLKQYEEDELLEEGLDLVYAARGEGADYDAFLSKLRDRKNNPKE